MTSSPATPERSLRPVARNQGIASSCPRWRGGRRDDRRSNDGTGCGGASATAAEPDAHGLAPLRKNRECLAGAVPGKITSKSNYQLPRPRISTVRVGSSWELGIGGWELSHIDHRAHGPASVACFVLTVSDTRSADTDTSGRAIRELLTAAGHGVSGHAIVRDEPTQVRDEVLAHCKDAATQVIITTGGTGITSRDGKLRSGGRPAGKRLHGFGELFRMLSFQEIGFGGDDEPGDRGNGARHGDLRVTGIGERVRLAMTRLIIPELTHVVQQVSK